MIKTVVFDFGNVLVDFKLERFVDQLSAQSSTSRQEIKRLASGSELEKRYSRGEISSEQFLKELKASLKLTLSTEEIARAYTASKVFSPNQAVLSLVKRLKGNYRLQLYSDTCQLHYDHVIKRSPVFPLFDEATISFQIGALKETEQGFKDVIEKSGCAPKEIAYTDDVKEYVDRARALGIRAVPFQDAEQLKRDFKRLGIEWED